MECQCKTGRSAKNFGEPGGLALGQKVDELAERAGERSELLEAPCVKSGPIGEFPRAFPILQPAAAACAAHGNCLYWRSLRTNPLDGALAAERACLQRVPGQVAAFSFENFIL